MPALRRLRRCLDSLAPANPTDPTRPAAAAGSGTLVLRDLESSPLRPADLMLGCAFNTVNEDRTGLTSAAEADAVGAVTTAIRLGINCLDTSAGYGAGTSEEFVGTGLAEAGVPSGPSWVDVWTKGGLCSQDICETVSSDLAPWPHPVGNVRSYALRVGNVRTGTGIIRTQYTAVP